MDTLREALQFPVISVSHQSIRRVMTFSHRTNDRRNELVKYVKDSLFSKQTVLEKMTKKQPKDIYQTLLLFDEKFAIINVFKDGEKIYEISFSNCDDLDGNLMYSKITISPINVDMSIDHLEEKEIRDLVQILNDDFRKSLTRQSKRSYYA